MKVNVLGRLEVQRDGEPPTPVRGRRNQQLLSLLTLHAGSAIPDAEMFDALWPGDLPADPAGAMRTYISRVRHLLPAEIVVRTPDGYQLNLEPAAIDVWRFQTQATLGISSTRSGAVGIAIKALEDAADLWRGDPWPMLSHLSAAETERLRLRELRMQSEEHLGAALLISGQSARGLRHLIGLVEAETLRELRWELLMRAHRDERNTAAALRAFQTARQGFIDQLGIEPSARLRSVELAILRGEDPGPIFDHRSERSAVITSPILSSAPSLIGRERATELFDDAIEGALNEGPPLVAVTGDAGMGKTSLLDLSTAAIGAETLVLRSQCHEAEAAGALRPIVDLLDDPEVRRRHHNSNDNQLRSILGVTESRDDDSAQLLLFDALSRLLCDHADEQRLLIVVDDVHWADPSTLQALAHVLRHRGSARIGLVVAYRDAEVRNATALDSVLDAAQHTGGVSTHELEGLGVDAVTALLERTHGLVEQSVVGRVMELTNGNPFLVTELARTANPADPATVPAGINRLVSRLTRGLEPAAMHILHDIALSTGNVSLAMLEEGVSAPESEVLRSLEEVIARHLVTEVPSSPAPEYSFTHAIFKKALMDGIIDARRLGIHHRLALASDALEAREGKRWTAIAAYHWHAAGRSGNPQRSIEVNLASAELAYANTAYTDALISFSRALESRDWTAMDSSDGGRLQIRIAESAHRCGDHQRRRSAALAALREAVAADNVDVIAKAALVHAGTRSAYGTIDTDTSSVLHTAAAALSAADRPDLRALVESRLAQELHQQGDYEGGLNLAHTTVEAARPLNDPALSVRTLMGLAWTMNHPEHYEQRVVVVEEMVAAAVRSQDAELETMAREWRCAALMEAGRTTELDVEMDRLSVLATQAPIPAQLVQLATLRAARVLMGGDLDRGIALAGEAYKMSLRYEPGMAEHVFRTQMLSPLREQGLLGSILPLVNEMIESFADVPGWRCVHAFVLSEVGDRDSAADIAVSIVRAGLDKIPHDLTWGHSMALLSETCANCELEEAAAVLIEQLNPFSGRSLPLWFILSGGAVDHYLGRLALVSGDATAAVELLEKAVGFHRIAGALPMALRSEIELGRAQRMLGDNRGVDFADTARRANEAGLVAIADLADSLSSETLKLKRN